MLGDGPVVSGETAGAAKDGGFAWSWILGGGGVGVDQRLSPSLSAFLTTFVFFTNLLLFLSFHFNTITISPYFIISNPKKKTIFRYSIVYFSILFPSPVCSSFCFLLHHSINCSTWMPILDQFYALLLQKTLLSLHLLFFFIIIIIFFRSRLVVVIIVMNTCPNNSIR